MDTDSRTSHGLIDKTQTGHGPTDYIVTDKHKTGTNHGHLQTIHN